GHRQDEGELDDPVVFAVPVRTDEVLLLVRDHAAPSRISRDGLKYSRPFSTTPSSPFPPSGLRAVSPKRALPMAAIIPSFATSSTSASASTKISRRRRATVLSGLKLTSSHRCRHARY